MGAMESCRKRRTMKNKRCYSTTTSRRSAAAGLLFIIALTGFVPRPVDAFSSPKIILRGCKVTSRDVTIGKTTTSLRLYPSGYRCDQPHKSVAYDPSRYKYEPNDDGNGGEVNGMMRAKLDDINASLQDIERTISTTQRDAYLVIASSNCGMSALGGLARRRRGRGLGRSGGGSVSNRRKKIRPFKHLKSFAKTIALSLALWQSSLLSSTHVADAARAATATLTPFKVKMEPGRYRVSSNYVDKVVAATRTANNKGKQRQQQPRYVKTTSSSTKTAIKSSRGGARKTGAAAAPAPPPQSAADKMRAKIIDMAEGTKTLASSGMELAQSGLERVKETADAHPKARTVAGVALAGMVGVGIGVEVAGGRGNNDNNKEQEEKLGNTDKLAKDIMADIDRYEERYGKWAKPKKDDDRSNGSGIAAADEPLEVRKPDPEAQVRAIIENAKETERRARAARSSTGGGAPSPGVDYSQVKGLSTKEGEGRERVQRLVDSTADMERRAEEHRLEIARKRDMDEEREALMAEKSLRNRIDSFISATEAVESNQIGGARPGDDGTKALRADVARLNSEMDRARTKVFMLEAELKEKTAVETMLRKEIDRLQRSG